MLFLCVLLCLGFVILGFGLNWVLLNCFVCGKCSLMSVPSCKLNNFLSLLTNSTNFFLIKKKKERKIFSLKKKKKVFTNQTLRDRFDGTDDE